MSEEYPVVVPTTEVRKRWRRISFDIFRRTKREKFEFFGQSIDAEPSLPDTIIQILSKLLREGPDTEGIFRIPPSIKQMADLKERLHSGKIVDITTECTVFEAASLLKEYMLLLPESLIPEDTFQSWIDVLKMENLRDQIQSSKRLLRNLSTNNLLLLQKLIMLYREISKKCDINKMTAANLAICVAPCIVRTTDFGIPSHKIVRFFIDNYDQVFLESL